MSANLISQILDQHHSSFQHIAAFRTFNFFFIFVKNCHVLRLQLVILIVIVVLDNDISSRWLSQIRLSQNLITTRLSRIS